ncbi:ABC transporter ATP-binding protein [Elusimicrobiota bacterium]
MSNASISINNVFKTFGGVTAVNGISFKVESGTCFALLGPNGAGKTTLMKMIYGKCLRDRTKEASIDILGYDPLRNELEIKYLSGIVAQEMNIDIELNVEQNMMMYSMFYGLSKKSALIRIKELLEFMELSDKSRSKIKELSGGMKRRLLIARALINEPKLLILDEPTTGLDPQVRHLIWNKLRELKKSGTTIILTTHYMEEAFYLADKIVILHLGKKIAEGNPKLLLEKNMEKYVLELTDPEFLDSEVVEKYKNSSKIRVDTSLGMLLLYSTSLEVLKKISDELDPGIYYLRQSNLEDLFLKMTGRILNEVQ